MVVPLKRRATPQRARKGASRPAKNDKPERPQGSLSDGFDALPPDFMLRALQMRYGHSTRRASRIRVSASETRLMGIIETGSSYSLVTRVTNAQDSLSDKICTLMVHKTPVFAENMPDRRQFESRMAQFRNAVIY